jgi:hypothetical protein
MLRKFMSLIDNGIYRTNDFIFYTILKREEVPLWADEIRWAYERFEFWVLGPEE